MKLTIFHFGDSHWITEHFNPVLNLTLPTQSQREFYNSYMEAFDKFPFHEYCEAETDKAVLVHTGDFANFYPNGCKSLLATEQFADIKKRHIKRLKKPFSKFVSHFIAVPGNHDLQMEDGFEEPKIKFQPFRNALGRWITPFRRVPIVRIPIDAKGEKNIALFLYNSAETVGGLKAKDPMNPAAPEEVVSAASVDFEKIKPKEEDYFRIAVLHHNILPQFGQREALIRKDIFINNGEFNKYLVRNNFKLVLSGHQHLDNYTYFSVSESIRTLSTIRSPMESLILSLSVPSFLREELTVEPGFNAIELEFSEATNFVRLHLTRFSYRRGDTDLKAEKKGTYHILMPRIEKVGLREERNRRLETMIKVVDQIYNPDFPIEELISVVETPKENDHFKRIADQLQANLGYGKNNIFGMYSAAILKPTTWLNHKKVFMKLLHENATRAVERARVFHHPKEASYYFKFSDPLYTAIQRALINANGLKIAAHLPKNNSKLRDDLEVSDLPFENEGMFSLSNWQRNSNEVRASVQPESALAHSPESKVGNLYMENSTLPILHEWTAEDSHDYPDDPFELARILIWPPQWLDAPCAREFIFVHEECLVPLFWLDPSRIKGETDKEREKFGYLLIYARKFRDHRETKNPLLQREPQVFCNNAKGEAIPLPERPYITLYGPDGAPEYFREQGTLSAEFASLLYRSDILFAADARAMVCLKQFDKIEPFLAKTYANDWRASDSSFASETLTQGVIL